jgi:hypothetical protein
MSNENEPKVNIEKIRELVAETRIVGHHDAAKSQIDQAIFLWFHRDHKYVVSDETSLHTLTIAVQGILWAYAHDSRQQPSRVAQAIESDPKHSRLKDSHNFFKHGSVGRKEKGKRKAVSHFPSLTDLFLADNVTTFNRLFMKSSPLMDMFVLRYSLTFPESGISVKTLEMKLIGSGHDLKTLASLNRKDFYELVGPYAIENLKAGR